MKNLTRKLSGAALVALVSVSGAFATGTVLETVGTAIEGTITSVTTVAGSIAVAGLALFAVVWGVKKLKGVAKGA